MVSERQGGLWPGRHPGDPGADRAEGVRLGDAVHAQRKRMARAAGRDVYIPPVRNPARRAACRLKLRRFIETYLKPAFPLPWSPVHLKIITRLEDSILHGRKYARAAPRGTGKSGLVDAAALWAILYGHRRFMAILSDTHDNTKLHMSTIRTWVETNELLYEDFPGPCACVRALEGVWNRANAQTVDGSRTFIRWGEGVHILAFPVVPNEPSAGARIAVRSMEKNVRGIKDTLTTGEIIRPDLVVLDDPIDKERAHSEHQVDKYEQRILSDVMGLGGPGVGITAFYIGTKIVHDDLTSRFVDRTRHPDWRGEADPFFSSMPSDMELWERYQEVREASWEQHGDERLANAFYAERRADLEAGAAVTWEARYEPDKGELSAIQHGMNQYFDLTPPVFMAEWQNQPVPPEEGALLVLGSLTVEQSDSGHRRGEVPNAALALASGWDVGKYGVHWVAGACAAGRRVSIVDYGVQGIDAPTGRIESSDKVKLRALELAVFGGLCRLREKFLDEPYANEAGKAVPMLLTLVDRGWLAEVVDRFCDESKGAAADHRLVVESIHGCGTRRDEPRYYIPKGAAMTHDGNVYLRAEPSTGRHHYYAHSDALKQVVQAGFLLDVDTPGSIALFPGEKRKTHHTFARHLTAEIQAEVAPGVWKWQAARGRADNHWLDAAYMMMAAFSILEHRIPSIGVGAGAPVEVQPAGFTRRKRRIVECPL